MKYRIIPEGKLADTLKSKKKCANLLSPLIFSLTSLDYRDKFNQHQKWNSTNERFQQ